MAAVKSSGMFRARNVNASTPPADVPRATMSRLLMAGTPCRSTAGRGPGSWPIFTLEQCFGALSCVKRRNILATPDQWIPMTADDKPTPFRADDPVVVAIGASAGGLRPLQAFFSALPADTGATFVVVVHLDPERRSELASILASRTRM